ncbi:hypothetical protein SK3146_03120 [Paenibacillus konkukensis]|uniref:DUF1963 domain-containing protein n=1 Tax=Paenibacillus konkukensis TaxID=2020716 RepID=A0ABY4RP70_9BACL|nr:YwqG family protein [Paenibacillus konkukensis]UQZ83913.1 hypothetical protein SK3146_03120 [Paenibacillus konkukensis]
MNLNEHQRHRLEQLIREHQFEHALPYLLEHTRQGIRCSKAGRAGEAQLCASRIGGDPDLPPEAEWPLTKDGVPMTFIAQLNLQELAKADEASLLPASGMLYFFVGVDEPAYDIEHRVLFSAEEELASAACRRSPETTALEETYSGYWVEPRATLEPPNYAYVDYEQVESETADYGDYEELGWAITESRSGDVARLFGYPDGQHDDSEYQAALMLLTGQHYDYSKARALERITAQLGGDERRAKREIEDTLMLLEVESDNEIGFCWWDAGVLHFFIRKEDLLAGRFDRTYCSLYSS